MNTKIKILIIAASLFLIVLIIFFSIISKNFKFGLSTNINPTPVETNRYETYGSKPTLLTRAQKLKEAAKMMKETENLFTSEQKESLKKLKDKIKTSSGKIIETDDFKMTYSEGTNQFYIQKKTLDAEEKLKEYLKENNVLDIYNKDPSVFILINENLDQYVKEQEDEIIGILESTEGTEEITGTGGTSITQTPGSMSQTEKEYYQKRTETRQNNLNIALDLFHSFTNPSNGSGPRLYDNLTMIEEEITPTQIPLPLNAPSTILSPTEIVTSSNNAPQELIYPTNLGIPNSLGYYLLPTSINDEYGSYVCPGRSWGSKALIGVFYTAAKKWHDKYPNSKFYNGDMNASGHTTSTGYVGHAYGTEFDLEVIGNPRAGHITDSIEANIEAGKMLIDSGIIKIINFGSYENDSRGIIIRNAWKEYANSKELPFRTWSVNDHDDHFHIKIYDEYKGPYSAPGC